MPTKIAEKSGSIRLSQVLEEFPEVINKIVVDRDLISKGIGDPCTLGLEGVDGDIYLDESTQQFWGYNIDNREQNTIDPAELDFGAVWDDTYEWALIDKAAPILSNGTIFTNGGNSFRILNLNSTAFISYNVYLVEVITQTSMPQPSGTYTDTFGNAYSFNFYIGTIYDDANIVDSVNYSVIYSPLLYTHNGYNFAWTGNYRHRFTSIDINSFSSTISEEVARSIKIVCAKDPQDLVDGNFYVIGDFNHTFITSTGVWGTIILDNINIPVDVDITTIAIYNTDCDNTLYDRNWHLRNLRCSYSLYDCNWQPLNDPKKNLWFQQYAIPAVVELTASTKTWSFTGLPYEGYYDVNSFVAIQDWTRVIVPPSFTRAIVSNADVLTVQGSGDPTPVTVDISINEGGGATPVKVYNNSLQGSIYAYCTGATCGNRKIDVTYTDPGNGNRLVIGGGYCHIDYKGPTLGTLC